VLEHAAIGKDALRAGGQGKLPHDAVIVLADGQDRQPGAGGRLDRADSVVGPRGQVDDDPVNVGEDRFQRRKRPDENRGRSGASDKLGQPGRPDQVVGQDADSRGQFIVSAR
jgi:hypothetical protein